MNVLPMVFLEKLAQLETSNADSTEVTLGTVDVKDAFLMVDQPTPLRVQLPSGNHTVLKKYQVKGWEPSAGIGISELT